MLTPLAFLISLVDALGSSALARQAESSRLKATLEALQSSLLSFGSNERPGEACKAAIGQFSNAAWDLFCEARLQASAAGGAQLEGLAQSVERVLSSMHRHQSITEQQSTELQKQLSAAIARLK